MFLDSKAILCAWGLGQHPTMTHLSLSHGRVLYSSVLATSCDYLLALKLTLERTLGWSASVVAPTVRLRLEAQANLARLSIEGKQGLF